MIKIVHLPLKYRYYEQIKSGEKTIEYRNKNMYWRLRLQGATHARMRKGYTKESMLFEIIKIEQKDLVFAIHLGKRINA